jgi:hypothetical protein
MAYQRHPPGIRFTDRQRAALIDQRVAQLAEAEAAKARPAVLTVGRRPAGGSSFPRATSCPKIWYDQRPQTQPVRVSAYCAGLAPTTGLAADLSSIAAWIGDVSTDD